MFQTLVVVVATSVGPISAGLLQQVRTERAVELTCDQALLAFLMPLAFNVALILVCAVLGFMSRKLPENFNESWYIFVSVATTLFMWAVFLPTYFTVYYAYQQAALLALCLILNAYITMGCLFVPKVYAVLCVDEKNIKLHSTTGISTRVATAGVTMVTQVEG